MFLLANSWLLFSFGRVWVDAASPWCSDWEDNKQRGLSRSQWKETAGCQSRESVRPFLRSWNYEITWSCSSLLTKGVKWQLVVAWKGILDTKKSKSEILSADGLEANRAFLTVICVCRIGCDFTAAWAWETVLHLWNSHSSLWSCKTSVLGMCELNCCFWPSK